MDKSIISELKERNVLVDMTGGSGLEELLLSEDKLVVYCGFDPTADSLHVGSLLPLMNMKRFMAHGHKVIALIGGATGLIGDPSFKENERSLNSLEVVEEFKKGIKKQITDFLGDEVILVDNLDWTQNMNVIEFLRDIGKHFTVNTMISKDSVKSRIARKDSGISFTEFSYQLLQGMDFLKLKELHGCNLQIGGSDQMGNITAGTNLIHRVKGSAEPAFGLTTKLITKSDGEKFGKSESGAIWLSKEKTSPFDFFQFWLKTEDKDVYDFLMSFSLLSVEEIKEIEIKDKDRRPEAQRILAEEITKLVHGEKGLEEALVITKSMVSGDFSALSCDLVEEIARKLDFIEIEDQISLVDGVILSGLAPSKTKAREFIKNKAISINGKKETNEFTILDSELSIHDRFIFLKRGKRILSAIIIKN